ncbi:MAG: hypothetical protein RLZZ231_206 [Bacteroidota bacterium]|jgi:hypothetical protein
MKVYSLFLLLMTQFVFSQMDCDYSTNVTDSLGTYKSTNSFTIHEKIFGGTSSYIFFSLVKADEMPSLNLQMIEKSNEFIKAYCFDKNSKIHFQLENGKLVTLLHIDNEDCGSSLRDEKGFNNRITTGYFLFMKDSYEELKKSPISLMRVKYTTETVDYIIRKEIKSELDAKTYRPSHYFIDYFKCVE